jgi:xanthine/uracil permease
MDTLFSRMKLPSTRPFKRPRDLLYASDERPPGATLVSLSIQHIATALALIAYVLAAGHIGGLNAENTRRMVTATLICMAITAILQAWGGKFGAGLLLIQAPTSIAVPIAGLVITQYGINGMVTVTLMYALLGIAISYILPRIRSLLPPMVAGIVLLLSGLALITPAMKHIGIESATHLNGTSLLIATVTLAVIVVLSVWGRNQYRLLSVLIGIFAGLVVSAIFGQLHDMALLRSEPVFGLPHFPTPTFDFTPGGFAALAVLALMSQLGTFACIVLMHKMNDENWRRTDVQMAGRGLRANALGNFVSALLGGYPCTTASTNVAVNHISHSTSRWVGLLTGLLIAAIAFLPQITMALTLAPVPIIGAVETYAAAYLVVSGIRLISSRAMDSRGIFTVGLSIVAGTAVMLIPSLAGFVPESIRFMFRSGVVVGGLVSIGLNLVFRLGVSQSAKLALCGSTNEPRPRGISEQIVDFIEDHGANWGARQEAITLAAQAALEATEAIAASGADCKVVEVQGSFDEFNLDIELRHTGAPLDLRQQHGTVDENLLDADDDAFEAALNKAMTGVSHVLLNRLADRITSGMRGDTAYVRLHFDH